MMKRERIYETEEDDSRSKLPKIKVAPLQELDSISDKESSETDNLETKLVQNINNFKGLLKNEGLNPNDK